MKMEEVKTEQSGRGSEEIIMTMIIPLGLGLIQVIGGERFSKGGGGMETNELVEGTWLVRRLSAAVVSTYLRFTCSSCARDGAESGEEGSGTCKGDGENAKDAARSGEWQSMRDFMGNFKIFHRRREEMSPIHQFFIFTYILRCFYCNKQKLKVISWIIFLV